MVATPNPNPNRPPLLPSETDYANNARSVSSRLKSKPVSSRYLLSPATSSSSYSSTSSSSSATSSFATPRRSASPVLPRVTPVPKPRSVSADRRRSSPIRRDDVAGVGKGCATRSLSVSFQGEAFSLPVRKAAVVVQTPVVRRRVGNSVPETPKRPEQQRWPARIRQVNPNSNSKCGNLLSNGFDCSLDYEKHNVVGSGGDKLGIERNAKLGTELNAKLGIERNDKLGIESNTKYSIELNAKLGIERNAKLGTELNAKLGIERNAKYGIELNSKLGVEANAKLGIESIDKYGIELNDKLGTESNAKLGIESNGKYGMESDAKLGVGWKDSSEEILRSMRRYPNSNETDSDSVSSGSSNSGRTVCSAKFWQEPIIRTPLPKYPPKMVVPPKFGQPKKFPMDASPRANSSPMRGSVRPSSPMRGSSPSRVRGSIDSLPSRGMPSPSRVRSSISSSFSETPSVLSYAVDVKRGKVGENQIMDAHTLRLLYNRQLQWRFVNARKEAVLLAQKCSVQKNLWNAWVRISKLRESVTKKTHQLHLMKQKLKLAYILKDQITYLENWASLDKGHCSSLFESIEALKGSTLRLPVVDGAITDLQSIKDAIGSAVDVMQAMASSICSLLSKVEEMSFLASELTKEISKEQDSLEQCKANFTKLAAQQVEYCSLRTHILQVNRMLPLA